MAMNGNGSQEGLKAAVNSVLNNNFDAVTQSCFITILKLLDNAIQKPNEPKFRSVNLSNNAIRNKICNAKHGLSVLLACGFVQTSNASLQLPDQVDDGIMLQRLVAARHLVASRCIQELKCRPEDLPKYNPPPSRPRVSSSNTNQGDGSFNPYEPQRFDALSASVGHALGPGDQYKSKIDSQVELLERQKQAKLSKSTITDRQWRATRPGESVDLTRMEESTKQSSASDMSLLAAKAMAKKEPEGFTTSSMRKLAKLQKTKVYDFTILQVRFPSGDTITGKFHPNETIGTVISELQSHCLERIVDFDLVAPPVRTVLDRSQTLETAQLVPAAKLNVRYASSDVAVIRSGLYATSSCATEAQQQQQQYPKGSSLATPKPKPTDHPPPSVSAEDREEALMRRMMGGGATKKGKSGKPIPKWFKK